MMPATSMTVWPLTRSSSIRISVDVKPNVAAHAAVEAAAAARPMA